MSKLYLTKLYQFVQEESKNFDLAHDYAHILRVVHWAKLIAKEMNTCVLTCEIAALFHDMADHKLTSNPDQQIKKIKKLFSEEKIPKPIQAEAITVIKHLSYSKQTPEYQKSEVFKIIEDADRLDAIGAIGIARTFAYSGAKNKPMLTGDYMQVESLLDKNNQSTIAHFHQKLLQLLPHFHSPLAKKIAQNKHNFMLLFLQQFYSEWEQK